MDDNKFFVVSVVVCERALKHITWLQVDAAFSSTS